MATRNRRFSRPAAEAALVMVAIGLMAAAAGAGFAVGRATAEDGGGSAEHAQTEGTTAQTETAETETAETEPTETEAETETQTETETGGGETGGTGEGPEGETVFAEAGCGGCHALAAANASGTVGPSLDETDLSRDEIEQVVRNGRDGMPAFEGQLSDEQIEAVSDFVENASG